MNGLNLADTARFSRRGENIYVAKQNIPYNSRMILAGDMVRQETPEYEDISEVKRLIDEALSGKGQSRILYHLDSDNLSKFTDDEIDRILSTAD